MIYAINYDQGIWDQLSSHVDGNDRILIVGIIHNCQGWLPDNAWKWISTRSFKAA